MALSVGLAVACLLLQLFAVRPFLPPAGHGATLDGETPLLKGSRPAAAGASAGARGVCRGRDRPRGPAGSAAPAAGLRPGDRVLHIRNLLTGHAVDRAPPSDALEAVRAWREAYRLGPRGALDVSGRHADGSAPARVDRPASWNLPWDLRCVRCRPTGPMIEMAAIVGAAVVLLLLRPRDLSALLIVGTLPWRHVNGRIAAWQRDGAAADSGAPLTVFAWMAMPSAFPLIALAILYFPRKSGAARAVPLAARPAGGCRAADDRSRGRHGALSCGR